MDRKKTLIKELHQFAKNLASEYPIKTMILFGSQVTGRMHKDSDVDLIIVSEKFEGVAKLDRAPDIYWKWNLDYPVDILCYTPKEFERKKKLIGIVKIAVDEGIPIIS